VQVVDGWLAELRLRRQGIEPCAKQHQKLVRKVGRVRDRPDSPSSHLGGAGEDAAAVEPERKLRGAESWTFTIDGWAPCRAVPHLGHRNEPVLLFMRGGQAFEPFGGYWPGVGGVRAGSIYDALGLRHVAFHPRANVVGASSEDNQQRKMSVTDQQLNDGGPYAHEESVGLIETPPVLPSLHPGDSFTSRRVGELHLAGPVRSGGSGVRLGRRRRSRGWTRSTGVKTCRRARSRINNERSGGRDGAGRYEWVRVIEKVAECLDAGISVEEIEAGLSPEGAGLGKVIRDIDRHYIRATPRALRCEGSGVEGSYRRRRRPEPGAHKEERVPRKTAMRRRDHHSRGSTG